jgi:hypothetical protein
MFSEIRKDKMEIHALKLKKYEINIEMLLIVCWVKDVLFLLKQSQSVVACCLLQRGGRLHGGS